MLSQSHQSNQDGGLVMVMAGHSSGAQVGSEPLQISDISGAQTNQLTLTTTTTSHQHSNLLRTGHGVFSQKQTLFFAMETEEKKT